MGHRFGDRPENNVSGFVGSPPTWIAVFNEDLAAVVLKIRTNAVEDEIIIFIFINKRFVAVWIFG